MSATIMSPGMTLKNSTGSSEQTTTTPGTPGLTLTGRRIHFVGIGGCGMSGLAHIAQRAGAHCTGSDLSPGPAIDALRAAEIPVILEQTAASVPQQCDLLVISAAIKADHPEVVEAQRRGLEILKYAQMLGRLMIGRRGIAIAGTHGKSSTTSMLSHVLIDSGFDPSFIVGANCTQIGGGSRTGRSDLLVAEACEFDRSFHNFFPTHAAILNVEEDHMEVYGSIDKIVEAFAHFAHLLPDNGSLLINHEMSHRIAITAGLNCLTQTIGFAPQADWCVQVGSSANVTAHVDAVATTPVTLLHHGKAVANWVCPMPGEHMAYNSAVAAVLAHRVGVPWDAIAKALGSFTGLDRRMQLLGVRHVTGGVVTVVDDYGHHPTEVETTLRALRRHYNPNRLICVFQPHQHSRTRFLLEQFATSFSHADIVVVPHIYFSRDSEEERRAVQAADLVDRLRQRKVQAMHLYPFGAIIEQLQLIGKPGDLIVTMGAGDVWKVAQGILQS